VFVPGRNLKTYNEWRRFREFRNSDTDIENNSHWRDFSDPFKKHNRSSLTDLQVCFFLTCIWLFGDTHTCYLKDLDFLSIWPLNDNNTQDSGLLEAGALFHIWILSLCSTQAIIQTSAEHTLWNKERLKMSKAHRKRRRCFQSCETPQSHTHAHTRSSFNTMPRQQCETVRDVLRWSEEKNRHMWITGDVSLNFV